MTVYFVPAGTPAKVARHGETPQDHPTTADQRFTEADLVARPESPGDNPAAAQWARRGYIVFKRGDWFLIVLDYDAQVEFWQDKPGE